MTYSGALIGLAPALASTLPVMAMMLVIHKTTQAISLVRNRLPLTSESSAVMQRDKPKRATRLSRKAKARRRNKEQQSQTLLRSVWNFLKHLSLASWLVAGALSTAIGLVIAVLYFWPEINIEPSASLDPSDALATKFKITNQSALPIYDVWYVAETWEGDTDFIARWPGMIVIPVPFVSMRKLESHTPFSARIDTSVIGAFRFEKPMLQIWAYYALTPWRWPTKRSGKRFYAQRDAGGQYQWYFAGQAEGFGPEHVPRLNP
jgi:hypothetical protein